MPDVSVESFSFLPLCTGVYGAKYRSKTGRHLNAADNLLHSVSCLTNLAATSGMY